MTGAKKDFMIGADIALNELKYDLIIKLAIKTRPYTRSVIYPINEQVSFQLWEKRTVLGLGVDKQFVLKRQTLQKYGGLLVGLDYIYTYGSFRGSNKKPDDGIYLIPKAGMFWNFKPLYISVNYEYFALENSRSSPHRINFSLAYRFKIKKNNFRLKSEPKL